VMVFHGFDYRRGTTAMHRIDPRSKMVYLILFTALTILFYNPFVLLLLLASSLPIVIAGKIYPRWSMSMKGSLFFIFFIFIFNFIAFIWGDFWGGALSIGTVYNAVVAAITMSIRFTALISIFSTFFLTTSPEDLTQSMVQLKIPYDYALTFNMAMRFVPTLGREAQYIIDAQKSRGLEMEKGNFVTRIKNYIPVLIPLIISSFRRAELVADAMESRAFGASKKRCSLYVLKISTKDYAFILITVASFLLILSLKLIFNIQ
jgi:energy-coupling factor transport system permease protein